MENIIIIAVIAVIALAAVRSAAGHFKGKGGCCGGGSEIRPRKKKLKQVTAVKVFHVEGMHCEKCAARVTEAINDLDHVAAVVDLKKNTVTVSYAREVPDELLQARLQRLGYTITP